MKRKMKGTFAEIENQLRIKGFRYVTGYPAKAVGDTVVYMNKQTGQHVSVVKVENGKTAEKVNEQISPKMWLTRTPATPDVYEVTI